MAPTWAENTIFALVDDGNEMFIGRYIMEKGEWEVLLPVSLFQEKLDEQIDASLFRNFRMMSGDDLTFVYDDVIYRYSPVTEEVEALLEGNHIQRFEWADEHTLLLLHEMGDLFVGWLEKYDIQTGESEVIDKSVTDFVYLPDDDQVAYAKKYFLGSWCEYELNFADIRNMKIAKNKRYYNASLGQLFLDADHNIFVVESHLSPDNELEVRRILRGTLGAVYITKVEDDCIGVR